MKMSDKKFAEWCRNFKKPCMDCPKNKTCEKFKLRKGKYPFEYHSEDGNE